MTSVEIPPEAFKEIIEELKRHPLRKNTERGNSGIGMSQAFGIVNRRMCPPDASRNNWQRPFLYKLLLDFAQKYVDIPYQGITVNQNYKAQPHKDRGNQGISYLVAFGDYTGGELKIHEGDLQGTHNINCKPMKLDFSKVLHSVQDFEGDRYSLVFYNLRREVPGSVPPFSVVQKGDKWIFMRGNEVCTRLYDHPLIGRKVNRTENVTVSFN
jgi:hypothetical protein